MLIYSVVILVGNFDVQFLVGLLQPEDFLRNLFIDRGYDLEHFLESTWAEVAESLDFGLHVQELHGPGIPEPEARLDLPCQRLLFLEMADCPAQFVDLASRNAQQARNFWLREDTSILCFVFFFVFFRL